MLILTGEKGNTVPHAVANASFKRERRNDRVTEIVEMCLNPPPLFEKKS